MLSGVGRSLGVVFLSRLDIHIGRSAPDRLVNCCESSFRGYVPWLQDNRRSGGDRANQVTGRPLGSHTCALKDVESRLDPRLARRESKGMNFFLRICADGLFPPPTLMGRIGGLDRGSGLPGSRIATASEQLSDASTQSAEGLSTAPKQHAQSSRRRLMAQCCQIHGAWVSSPRCSYASMRGDRCLI
jgi:hypothetical protein